MFTWKAGMHIQIYIGTLFDRITYSAQMHSLLCRIYIKYYFHSSNN